MELLELPPELLHKVLYYAVLVRHVKRGLRLRLVCKFFSSATYPALFETRLLDHFYSGVAEDWQIRNQHNAEKVWHSYLVYRTKNEADEKIGRFMEIRQVAESICKQTDHDLSSTIDSLCWLAFERKASAPSFRSGRVDLERTYKIHLLSAATYFNLVPFAHELLAEGSHPTDHEGLFPPAMEVAAQTGNTQLLKCFQEQLPELEFKEPDIKWAGHKWDWGWHGKVAPDSIVGAMIRGDLNILKLSLYPPSRAEPYNTDILGHPCGQIRERSHLGRTLRQNVRDKTRSIEIYDYVDGLFKSRTENEDLIRSLIVHAEFGNISMVRCLLDRGISVNAATERGGVPKTALIAACEHCHENIVNLLLERGADPNAGAKEKQWLTALPTAACSGSLTIVQKLLSYGAHVNEAVDFWSGERRPAVWWAVAIEHTAMFELLLENGASLDGYIGSTALEMAFEFDLMSMAEILQKHGAKIIERVNDSERAPWKKWACRRIPMG
ncbi:Ankyrin repeat-containing protein [Glarea lozoyensis ATCC 20868]|uniref:Ankyrin repeat-containing protein n=1 Tax=Glarea lozoyensis (strain ATCC 20868 / MF5171) TaxID=1116229 RepID=S3CVK1_GLAL2|nr:Ankyrin repeat-containing protein [Glarea lozoyensis ATCC 20868]EPE30442.1 Ankyrin repeat-containing protein [Glarea lozoyensis ATCC 20868]